MKTIRLVLLTLILIAGLSGLISYYGELGIYLSIAFALAFFVGIDRWRRFRSDRMVRSLTPNF